MVARPSDVWNVPVVVFPIEHDGTNPRLARIKKTMAGRSLL
jgi:hypothetical protein